MARSDAIFAAEDERWMRRALALAARGYGGVSPNPMVGAVIVRNGRVLGEGWHERAGEAHAEIRALANTRRRGHPVKGATIYVTLEPCCTFDRTPPCTSALIESGVAEVIVSATDPNPKHAGKGLDLLRAAGIKVRAGLLADDSNALNEAFNHWIVHKRPFVLLKSAMSLDGKIATNTGESQWITSEKSRQFGMRLRVGADAIVAGVNTVIRDNPSLTLRPGPGVKIPPWKKFVRVILDPNGRIPLSAKVLTDGGTTLVVLSPKAPRKSVEAIEKLAETLTLPLRARAECFDLRSLLKELARREITSVLIEGGGETHATFLAQRLVNRVYCFYAPLVICGRIAAKGVGGRMLGENGWRIDEPRWSKFGPDLLLSGLVARESI